ncbi:hypothetical protein L596_006823 [Steinernema carpocapsae]|uniref:Uncharacterized protein n=1 Tax=Steinernema carpocapsae TaxID=34508 RepID=A0A4U5P6X3_STECR|nr:hypothetical protein L596_006823 [Steinernema carpocapsae]
MSLLRRSQKTIMKIFKPKKLQEASSNLLSPLFEKRSLEPKHPASRRLRRKSPWQCIEPCHGHTTAVA